MQTENTAPTPETEETPRQRAEREAQELMVIHRAALADGSVNESEQWQIYGAYREYAQALQAGSLTAAEIQEIARTYGLTDEVRGSVGALVPPEEFNRGHFTPPETPYQPPQDSAENNLKR